MLVMQHPNVPHVICAQAGPGLFQCQCQICGAQMGSPAPGQGADRFAQVHSQHQQAAPQPSHYGLGDVIAGATKAVGIKPCAPCQRRQQTLNGWLPRLFRR